MCVCVCVLFVRLFVCFNHFAKHIPSILFLFLLLLLLLLFYFILREWESGGWEGESVCVCGGEGGGVGMFLLGLPTLLCSE